LPAALYKEDFSRLSDAEIFQATEAQCIKKNLESVTDLENLLVDKSLAFPRCPTF
jgi:hypothetical protein